MPVGAGIVSIVTESLYDKPIVVFREYIQNSVDSFSKSQNDDNFEDLIANVWRKNNKLFFLDNGNGIKKTDFEKAMKNIAFSSKNKITNIGYKGIGRLSGISYCDKLTFINICDYKEHIIQKYDINCSEFNVIKKEETFNQITADQLMDRIGQFNDNLEPSEIDIIYAELTPYNAMFDQHNTGFLVILHDISHVLMETITNANFEDELNWLLPVKFKDELFEGDEKELFFELSGQEHNKVIPAMSYNIKFENRILERPIEKKMLRDFLCKKDFTYAIGFYSFSRDKIAIDRTNKFSGIKIYLDNMLLCDENELLPILSKYGYLNGSANEFIQTVRGIGAIIYITDKINISTNARRTFIEIVDTDSLHFLELMAQFIKDIYDARYALSKYKSGKEKYRQGEKELADLMKTAQDALTTLASENITIEYPIVNSENLDETQKKRLLKKEIMKNINEKIKEYLLQVSTTEIKQETAFEDFVTWLK